MYCFSFVGSETTSYAERQQLHDQYRRIVEEIMVNQRNRLQQGGNAPAVSTSGVVPRLADTARAPFTNPPPRVDLDAERPHSPTQVDALNNAREYASAISRQANVNPIDLSSRQTNELLANARALAASVSRSSTRGRPSETVSSSSNGGGLLVTTSASRTRMTSSSVASSSSMDTRPAWGPGTGIRNLLDRSMSSSSESTPVSRSSDFTIWAPRSQASSSANFLMSSLSGSSTITTSSGGALNQETQSGAHPPTSTSSMVSHSTRGISLLQSQLESENSASAAGTPSVQQSFFTSMLRMRNSPETQSQPPESTITPSSWLPASAIAGNIVRPVTVVSLPSPPDTPASSVDRPPSSETVSSLATAVPQQRLGRSSSSGQPGVATVLMSHLWPSTSNTDSSTSTTSSSHIITAAPSRNRHFVRMPRSGGSDTPAGPDQCQVCGNYSRASGCTRRGCHVCSEHLSHGSSVQAPASALDSPRPGSTVQLPFSMVQSTPSTSRPSSSRSSRSGSQTIASLIESEVRQTLDQVRARRLDISETLRDLDNLRRELENSPGNSDSNDPNSQQSSDDGGQARISADPALNITSHLTSNSSDSSVTIDTEPVSSASEQLLPIHLSMPSMNLTDSLLGAPFEEYQDSVQEPDNPETPSAAPPRQIPLIVVDPYDEDSSSNHGNNDNTHTYRDINSSASGDPLSLPSDPRVPSSNTVTLQRIDMFSAVLERRVHQLDQRVTEIQDRLRDRMNALQRER